MFGSGTLLRGAVLRVARGRMVTEGECISVQDSPIELDPEVTLYQRDTKLYYVLASGTPNELDEWLIKLPGFLEGEIGVTLDGTLCPMVSWGLLSTEPDGTFHGAATHRTAHQ